MTVIAGQAARAVAPRATARAAAGTGTATAKKTPAKKTPAKKTPASTAPASKVDAPADVDPFPERAPDAAPAPAPDRPAPSRGSFAAGLQPARTASEPIAGFILGVLVWAWVVAPFLNPPRGRGRLAAVQDVLRAKLINQGPDGEPLP